MIIKVDGVLYARYRDTYYFCDEEGNVYRAWKIKGLKQIHPYVKKTGKSAGKYIVHICENYKRKEVTVSRMVWESFRGPIPNGYFITHKNGAKSCNELYNLELHTQEELGKNFGGNTGRTKHIINLDTNKIYKGTRQCAKDLYVSRQTVSDICNGKRKKKCVNIAWYER